MQELGAQGKRWVKRDGATAPRQGRLSFDALPPYPGGKRRLTPVIFGALSSVASPDTWRSLTFADVFAGGGSVSLSAKAHGFGTVLANDVAERSQVVARALIANSTTRLNSTSLLRALHNESSSSTAARILHRLPRGTSDHFARFQSVLASDQLPGAQRDLAALVCLKQLLGCFPMSLPNATDAVHVSDGSFDRVSHARLPHYLRASERVTSPKHLAKIVDDVNRAVFPGAGVVFGLDAFDFLANITADVVYLDPPYGGTQSYEQAFALIDEFLGVEDQLPPSPFSTRRPPLDELLDACRDIPVLIMSLNNTLLAEDDMAALIKRHRRLVKLIAVPYRHYGSVATAAKNQRNVEFLALGVRDGA